jgi:hypothetical protein
VQETHGKLLNVENAGDIIFEKRKGKQEDKK